MPSSRSWVASVRTCSPSSVQPSWLLVQGDTTTAFAAAFAGYQHRVRVGHIEAGLRTSDKWQPFPEEMNRRLVTVLADLHFAPTQRAMNALTAEGVPADRICVTGNTVVDALQEILKRPASFADPRLRTLTGRIVLLTAHRRENFGERLEQICLAATDLLRKFPDVTLVFPVHPNPHVTEMANRLLGGESRGLMFMDPRRGRLEKTLVYRLYLGEFLAYVRVGKDRFAPKLAACELRGSDELKVTERAFDQSKDFLAMRRTAQAARQRDIAVNTRRTACKTKVRRK